MSFTHLQSLSALVAPSQPAPIAEAKKPKDSFHAIQDFVSDSISDLEDALGSSDKDGSLYGLEPRNSVAKLKKVLATFKAEVEKVMTEVEVDFMSDEADDAKKVVEGKDGGKGWYCLDKDGTCAGPHKSKDAAQTWMKRSKLFSQRPDGLVDYGYDNGTKFVKSKPPISENEQLTEAKDYEDSGDFTDELFTVGDHIAKMKQTTRQPRWTNWMKVTDDNFSTSCDALNKDFTEALKVLDKAFDALEDELHTAS